MKRGTTLIEVMVALCILMICMAAFARMHLVCTYAKSSGEKLTRATVLGITKLGVMRNIQITEPLLHAGWHQDDMNPLPEGDIRFFRFWEVNDTSFGKDVSMYVAWADKERIRIWNFGSLQELNSSRCPRIGLRELIPCRQ